MNRRSLVVALVLLVASPAAAQELRIQPYVQDATPSSAWILWETTDGEESRVEWGATAALGTTATGTAQASIGAARVHEVALTGLAPATRYHYRVHTGAAASEVFHFTTPPARDAEVTFRMIAVSDMQNDAANPDVYRDIIHRGILDFAASEFAPLPDDAIAFVLVPGDLVDDGLEHESWRTEFFDPGADLMSYVPFYPVLGNHEHNSEHYYRYFHLPEHGGESDPERWWRMDYGNVRVIGLDSDLGLLIGDQESFLEESLGEACIDDHIDFVVVELHHAHLSELWPRGEAAFATRVVDRMNRFSTECGRPTLQLYGHTHGYSRGVSRDHAHLSINVASAGGNIDYWGEYDDQYDADEISVSQDEWGFVVIEVEAGDDPSFRLRRISLGNETTPRANDVRDEIVIRRYDEPPVAPSPRMPRGRVQRACGTLAASAFSDPDGDLHGASHWQISTSCDDFEAPILERHRQHENWYAGIDTQAGDDLTDEPIEGLADATYYCWRARYRDRSLAWSAWSAPVAFTFDATGVGEDAECDDPEPLSPPAMPGAEPPPSSPATCGCRIVGAGSPGALLGIALIALASLARRRR